MNREQWLELAVQKLKDGFFAPIGETVPPVRVSIGLPSSRALSSKRRSIGECWSPNSSKDGLSQVFISPILTDSNVILATLAHELIHAIVPDAGHKKPFKRIALAVGLTGKMTATVAGPELLIRLNDLIKEIGEIPHAALCPSEVTRKKQSTRMIKVKCSSCGYIARTSQTWLDTIGAPLCACNQQPMREVEK